MRQVKLLTSMAGINFSHNAGDVIDCHDAEAIRFIEAGIAQPVGTSRVERATVKRTVRRAVKEE